MIIFCGRHLKMIHQHRNLCTSVICLPCFFSTCRINNDKNYQQFLSKNKAIEASDEKVYKNKF